MTTTSMPFLARLPALISHATTHPNPNKTNKAAMPQKNDTMAVSSVVVETLQLSRPNDLVRSSKRSGSKGQM